MGHSLEVRGPSSYNKRTQARTILINHSHANEKYIHRSHNATNTHSLSHKHFFLGQGANFAGAKIKGDWRNADLSGAKVTQTQYNSLAGQLCQENLLAALAASPAELAASPTLAVLAALAASPANCERIVP